MIPRLLNLVHVSWIELDTGDAAGAGQAGAVLGRVRHVKNKPVLKLRKSFFRAARSSSISPGTQGMDFLKG